MENIYSCPICGSTEMKQNGTQFSCRFCKNTFTEEELRARINAVGSQSSTGDGASSTSTGGSGRINSPAVGYIGTMFGNSVPPQSTGGFSAPPESLIQSLQQNAAVNRQASGGGNDESGSENENGRGSSRGGNSRGGGSGGNGRGSGRASGGGSSGGNSENGGSTSGNSSESQNSDNSNASDSENNVRFLDNVSLMNDLAYELVNGNANAWANIARDKGIINSKQHTEIKYIVATRNCIAHGSGDSVKVTAELVKSARNYYELMRRTASQIK